MFISRASIVFVGPAVKPLVPHARPCFMGRSYVTVSVASPPVALTTCGGAALGLGIAAVEGVGATGDADGTEVADDPASPHPMTAISPSAMISDRPRMEPPLVDRRPRVVMRDAVSWLQRRAP